MGLQRRAELCARSTGTSRQSYGKGGGSHAACWHRDRPLASTPFGAGVQPTAAGTGARTSINGMEKKG